MKTHAIAFVLSAALLAPIFAHGKESALTDANILAIGAASHQAEIDAAQIALATSSNPEVKMFAEQMVTEHSAALAKATALASKLSVVPEENDDVAALKKDAAATADRLRALSGADFDKAYVSAMVKDHQGVLDALDRKLIPGAKNPELKKYLTDLRPMVAMHLERARTLQRKLGGTT
jgi:putative membrane protein